jgi:hypothetical protein
MRRCAALCWTVTACTACGVRLTWVCCVQRTTCHAAAALGVHRPARRLVGRASDTRGGDRTSQCSREPVRCPRSSARPPPRTALCALRPSRCFCPPRMRQRMEDSARMPLAHEFAHSAAILRHHTSDVYVTRCMLHVARLACNAALRRDRRLPQARVQALPRARATGLPKALAPGSSGPALRPSPFVAA